MTELVKALNTLFQGSNDFNTAIGGRVYFADTPQNEVFPYAVFYLLDRSFDWTFDTDISNTLLQVSFYSDERSVEQILALSGYLKALLDYKDTTLTVTDHDFIYIKQTGITPPIRDEDGVWECIHRYEIEMEQGE